MSYKITLQIMCVYRFHHTIVFAFVGFLDTIKLECVMDCKGLCHGLCWSVCKGLCHGTGHDTILFYDHS